MSGVTTEYHRTDDGCFAAPLLLTYPYSRTVGDTLARFFTSLRDGRIEGTRGSDGRVYVPPAEFDPITGERCTEWVQVGEQGTVTSWAWQSEPQPGHPLEHPFAWALIRLDGADVEMFHAVDARDSDAIATGSRVTVRWSAERLGGITDIACFDLFPGGAEPGSETQADDALDHGTPIDDASSDEVLRLRQPVTVTYEWSAGPGASRHLEGLLEGRLLGRRCTSCEQVYFPPRNGVCPRCATPLGEAVEVGPQGTITTFCIVNVPFLGQRVKIPYVAAQIVLDGADISMQHLIQECEAHEVRIGMRVEPVWKPREEWGPSLENIQYFRPNGEADAVMIRATS